jgi:hypothetical protein
MPLLPERRAAALGQNSVTLKAPPAVIAAWGA